MFDYRIEYLLTQIFWLLIYYILFAFVRGIYRNCIRIPKNLKTRYSQPSVPVWACITGATSGIGLQFSRELARRGFNILLVSRSELKLKGIQKNLKSEFNKINFAYLVADFGSDQRLQFYQKLAQDISKYDIGLFINNAGIMEIGSFLEVDPDTTMKMMEVNMFPTALLTHFVLPKLRARKAKSGIINVSSTVAQFESIPHNAVYSATKAFDDYLSRALAMDNDDKVDILSLRPGPVSTALFKPRYPVPGMISPAQCAKYALRSLGHDDTTNGHYLHGLMAFSMKLFPVGIQKVAWFTMFKILNVVEKKKVELIY